MSATFLLSFYLESAAHTYLTDLNKMMAFIDVMAQLDSCSDYIIQYLIHRVADLSGHAFWQ
jgi:hypothetical protein